MPTSQSSHDAMNKDNIRNYIRTRKALLNQEERFSAAEAVFRMLEQTPAFLMAEHIMVYHSLPDELSTLEFINKWHEKKKFFLPRVNGANLEILPYNRQKLHLGAFHIEEPDGEDIIPVENIELIIVPGVAFSRKGARVGRGKGFYDRLLADSTAVKVGVAYDFQLVDDIDIEAHDVPVDIVITDKNIYYCGRR